MAVWPIRIAVSGRSWSTISSGIGRSSETTSRPRVSNRRRVAASQMRSRVRGSGSTRISGFAIKPFLPCRPFVRGRQRENYRLNRVEGSVRNNPPRRPGPSAFADQLQPGVLVQHRDAELGGLLGLRAGVGADHQIVGLLRDRAGDLGAQRLGARLGLGAGHLLQRAGEDDGLAGDRRIGDGLPGAVNSATVDLALEIVEQVEVMLLGEEADDIGGDRGADAVDVVELVIAPGSRDPGPRSSPRASARSEP